MFKDVAKLKPDGLEFKSRLESKRPRVVKRLDPTVWWLAGVILEKRPLRSGTGVASSCSLPCPALSRHEPNATHYYVTCQAFPSGPREYENTSDTLTLLSGDRL